MPKSPWVEITAIVVLGAVGVTALVLNHDGAIIIGLVSCVAGIAGYHIGQNS